MLGLGEEKHEVLATMQDLAAQGVPTFSRSDNICNPLAIIYPSFATFIPVNSPNTKC